jgi:lysophospholipase L1-like esterase
MKRLLSLVLALGLAGPALADHPAECTVARHLLDRSFSLPHVAKALAGRKLSVLVVGAGSSVLPGPAGASKAYPARLQAALKDAWPGVTVTVATDVKSRRTAAAMLQAMPKALAAAKPQLVIWQTGTVDAMLAADPDQFSDTLEAGIALARKAGADVILVNAQYSPRTESMIALSTYTEEIRWVALQHNVPLFDRLAIMKLWAELGTFDFMGARNKLDTALRVHDCIGRLLADLVSGAAKARRVTD